MDARHPSYQMISDDLQRQLQCGIIITMNRVHPIPCAVRAGALLLLAL